jgi:hypothetical protein
MNLQHILKQVGELWNETKNITVNFFLNNAKPLQLVS